MEIRITSIEDVGEDVLRTTGIVTLFDAEGNAAQQIPVTATGWVSATTNHFGEECYQQRGGERHRKDTAKPRLMTEVEVGHYCYRLLREAYLNSLRAPARVFGVPEGAFQG